MISETKTNKKSGLKAFLLTCALAVLSLSFFVPAGLVHAAPTLSVSGIPSPIPANKPFSFSALLTSDSTTGFDGLSGSFEVCDAQNGSCSAAGVLTGDVGTSVNTTLTVSDPSFLAASGTLTIHFSGSDNSGNYDVTTSAPYTSSGSGTTPAATDLSIIANLKSSTGTGSTKTYAYELVAAFGGVACTGDTGPCAGRTFNWQLGTATGSCTNNVICSATVTSQTTVTLISAKNGGDALTATKIITPGIGDNPAGANGSASSADPEATSCFNPSRGGPIKCALTAIVTYLTSMLTTFIFWIYGSIVQPIMQIALSIQPHDPAFASVILPVWVVIRNLMNILFVVALIVLGLTTLFGKGNYKSALVRIALTALLVNFSLVIAQALLGIADAAQAQFLPNNVQVLAYLGAKLIKGPNDNLLNNYIQGGSWQTILQAFIYLMFSFASLVVLGAVTVFLFLRIIIMWFLLFLSPIAYAGYSLDYTKKYANQWWDNFIKWALFTPIVGLLLHVCAVIADSQSSYTAKVLINNFPSSLYPSLGQFIYNGLSNILIIACLLMTLKIAKEFGGSAAGKVGDFATRLARRPITATGNALRGGARAVGSGVSAVGGVASARVLRYKQEKTANWVRGEDGAAKKGVTGALGRIAFNIANPKTSFKTFQKGQQDKRDFAAGMAAAAADQTRYYRTHYKQDDNRALSNFQKKKREEELSGKFGMKPQEIQDKLQEFSNKKKAGADAKTMQAIDNQISLLLEAAAHKGMLQKLTTDKKSDPVSVLNAIKKYTGDDTKLLKEIAKRMGAAAGKNNNIAMVGFDKFVKDDGTYDAESLKKMRAEQFKLVENIEPEEINKIKIEGLVLPAEHSVADPGLTQIKDQLTGYYNEKLGVNQKRNVRKEIKEFINVSTIEDTDNSTRPAAGPPPPPAEPTGH